MLPHRLSKIIARVVLLAYSTQLLEPVYAAQREEHSSNQQQFSIEIPQTNDDLLQSNCINVPHSSFTNNNTVEALEFNFHGKKLLNSEDALLHVGRAMTVSEGEFVNNGNFVMDNGTYTQPSGGFLNSGLWQHTGDFNLGRTELQNTAQGNINWKYGYLNFAEGTRYENLGIWRLEGIIPSSQLNMNNFGAFVSINNTLVFLNLFNDQSGKIFFVGNERQKVLFGQNVGFLQGDQLPLEILNNFANAGDLTLKGLFGPGKFTNRKNLTIKAPDEGGTSIEIKELCNERSDNSAPRIMGTTLIFGSGNTFFKNGENSSVTATQLTFLMPNDLTFLPLGIPASRERYGIFNYGAMIADFMNIIRDTASNSGLMKAMELTFRGALFHNFPKSLLSVDKKVDFQARTFNNEGDFILKEGSFSQLSGIIGNSGLWESKGDIDFGSTQLRNTSSGTMTWEGGKWTHNPGMTYENRGNLFLIAMRNFEDSITGCPYKPTLINRKLLNLKDSFLQFETVSNYSDFILSGGGHIKINKLENNQQILSFLDQDWTMTDDPTNTAPNRLEVGDFDGILKIESEKNFIYDVLKLPPPIEGLENVHFSPRFLSHFSQYDIFSSDARKDITAKESSYVYPFLKIVQDYTFTNINHLNLEILSSFTLLHKLQAGTIILKIHGTFTNGTSNTTMGTIAATAGPLEITCHDYDGRYGKGYGYGPSFLKTTHGLVRIGALLKAMHSARRETDLRFPYEWNTSNGSYFASGSTLSIEAFTELFLEYGKLYSVGNQTLKAENLIKNLGGNINCFADIFVETKKYFLGRSDPIVFPQKYKKSGYKSRWNDIYPGSGPATMNALGNISFILNEIESISSTILGGKVISVNGIEIKDVKDGYKENNQLFYYRYYLGVDKKRKKTQVNNVAHQWSELSLTQAGQAINMAVENFGFSGIMNAPVVNIHANNDIRCENRDRVRREISPTEPVMINLVDVYQQYAQDNGIYQVTPLNEIVTEFPLGQPDPIAPENMLFLEGPLVLTTLLPEAETVPEVQPPVEVQPPIEIQAPIEVQTPVEVQAPVEIQTPAAPVATQAPAPTKISKEEKKVQKKAEKRQQKQKKENEKLKRKQDKLDQLNKKAKSKQEEQEQNQRKLIPIKPTIIQSPGEYLNPIKNLNINGGIQQMLSKYAGKVFIHKGLGELASGSELFETLAENTLRWMKKSGKSTINARDLKNIKEPMIFYQRHLVDGVYQVSTILALPPSEINRLQSSGDMSGNLITLDAGRNQIHLNNRLVAIAALNVIAKGALERRTEKYTLVSQVGNTRISEEHAMPQQTFSCIDGPVNTMSEDNTEELGTLTLGTNVGIKSNQGSIIEKTLVLEKKETKTKKKKKMLGQSKEETKETITHSHMQPTKVATDGSITKDGKKTIEQSGSKNVATEAITYKGGELKSTSVISIDAVLKRKKKKGVCSKVEEQSRQEGVSAALSLDQAPTLNVETVKASMEGVDIKAETLNDRAGGTYAPKTAEVHYHQSVKSKQPLAKSNCGAKGGQEVEIRTKLDVKVINRLAPGQTEYDPNAILSPLKFENVDWDKEHTQVNGKIEESFRELKSWQKKWAKQSQVIPKAAVMVIALAVSFATSGVAGPYFASAITALTGGAVPVSALAASMASAGFQTLCTTAASSMATHGDPFATAEHLVSKDALKNLAIDVATAGIYEQLGGYIDTYLKTLNLTPEVKNVVDPLRKHALNKVVGLGVHAAAGDKIGLTDIRNAAINITVDMFIDSCAQKLGAEYKLKEIDYLTHKFGHFGVGAFKGAISNLIQGEDVLEGALVGGAAGAGAEILGEEFIKVQEIRNEVIQEAIDERRPIVGDEYIKEVNKRIDRQTDYIKIAMAGVAAIAGQNPHLGADCAANALENNCLHLVVGGAAAGLVVALEAAGVVEAAAVANVIWGALGTGIFITGCQVAKDNLPKSSSSFEESPWINGPTINGTPIADRLPDLEGYQPAPQDYNTTITTPIADPIGGNEGYEAAPQDVLHYKIPGFTPVDLPDTFILMNEKYGGNTSKNLETFNALGLIGTVANESRLLQGLDLAKSNVVQLAGIEMDHKNISNNPGRAGKQKQLRKLMNDDKVSSADRGWLQQDANQIARNKRKNLRVPIGKELAHQRGFEAAKGFDYSHAVLQEKNLHKLQHKYDGMGKKNAKKITDNK